MKNYELLKKYYKDVCTPLIFVGENIMNEHSNVKAYIYNFKKQDELENYKKVFQEYMLMYVRNYDMLEYYDFSNEISTNLVKEFNNIFFNETPRRETATNGIFGELFNDYYLKNILDEETMLLYAYRKVYNSNSEAKGIDVVCCDEKNNILEITLSEAKFVGTLTRAKNSLIEDICGKDNHLNDEYINSYMNFVLSRQPGSEKNRRESISQKINLINKKMISERKSFITVMNELNNSIKFVYFAIFQYENNRDIDSFKIAAEEILTKFKNQVLGVGINNYSIDIVFIPTFNTSMALKYKMEEKNE